MNSCENVPLVLVRAKGHFLLARVGEGGAVQLTLMETSQNEGKKERQKNERKKKRRTVPPRPNRLIKVEPINLISIDFDLPKIPPSEEVGRKKSGIFEKATFLKSDCFEKAVVYRSLTFYSKGRNRHPGSDGVVISH